jgi:hypothetical protein
MEEIELDIPIVIICVVVIITDFWLVLRLTH